MRSTRENAIRALKTYAKNRARNPPRLAKCARDGGDVSARRRITAPGETLADILVERGWSQRELSRRSGVHFVMICDVLKGRRGIGVRTALGLQRATKVPAEFWLTRQAHYDLDVLLRRLHRHRRKRA